MFEHLKKYEGQATAWLDIPELGDHARIELMQASEQNSAYYNALLRTTGKRVRRMAIRIDPADAARNRNEDRQLFPKYVIVSWENVESEKHSPESPDYIEYSRELAAELCKKLPAHLFDRIRGFAATPEEFYPDTDIPPDAEEVAKN
jgi:hypothetical protein